MKQDILIKNVKRFTIKHSPEILTGLGIAGMITTAVMTGNATIKAVKLIENKKETNDFSELTKKETIKIVWRCYFPPVVTGVVSTACIIFASSVNLKRNTALAAAYALSETALKEYQDKVVEVIGEKKERLVKDSVAKDIISKNPVNNNEVIITEKGNTLCYDVISGRYFKSDIEKIKQIKNELNSRMLNDSDISLNDFYYELGLDSILIGDDLGWNVNKGLIDLDFSSQLSADGEPCLVINYRVAPTYNY